MNWLLRHKYSTSGKIVIYHATIAGSQIMQTGFKTRSQLNEKSSLGGGPNDAISFTTDWSVAKGVFDGLLLACNIMNDPNPLQFIKKHFYSLNSNVQSKVLSLLDAIAGGANSKYIDYLFAGKKLDGAWGYGKLSRPMRLEELNSLGYEPSGESQEDFYYNWFKPMDTNEITSFLYSYLKAYHSGSGVYDPVFFGTAMENFKGVNRQDVGIVTAEAEIDPNRRGVDDFIRKDENPSHRYVSSMAEIRIQDLKTIQILDFDANPQSKPKFTSSTHYYGKKENFAIGINKLLDFFYKRYGPLHTLLNKHGIAIDSFISLLQYYGEDSRNLWTVVSALKNKLGINNLESSKYMLQNYIRRKQQIAIPKEIQNFINLLPERYQNRLLSGEKSDDVLSDMYDNNKILYNKIYDQYLDEFYTIENQLREWSKYRYDNLQRYNEYEKSDKIEKQLAEELFSGATPELLLNLIDILIEVNKDFMKQSSVNNWLLKSILSEKSFENKH